MKISRTVLQTFFADPLPSTERIVQALTQKSFEVEGVETINGDDCLDIDVLPNRSSDCLSHLGIAREVGVVLGLKTLIPAPAPEVEEENRESIAVSIEQGTARRFIALAVSGVDNTGESPIWLKNALVTLGERSVSPIVDITNYVLLLTGQPLHAYDRDKLEKLTGGRLSFHVGYSKPGEELQTLDGAEFKLTGKELLITTGEEKDRALLGFAGVKGGMSTAVDPSTKRVVFEAACFHPTLVRKSAQALKLHTAASKRFENEVPSELSALGIKRAFELLTEMNPELEVDALKDEYREKSEARTITLEPDHAPKLLGVEIDKDTQVTLLRALDCAVKEEGDSLAVTPPWYRLDLKQAVDLVEEVGRLSDYANIQAKELEPSTAQVSKRESAHQALRHALLGQGYSEIITRSFREKGEVELENPLAKNTPFLRKNLRENMEDALTLNAQNAELLELEYIRIFEIGTVFSLTEESTHLALGVQKTKNARGKLDLTEEIRSAETSLGEALGVDLSGVRVEAHEEKDRVIYEYDLSTLKEENLSAEWKDTHVEFKHFKPFSVYPYVIRDIAVWTPEGTTADDVRRVIEEHTSEGLQVVTLFDQFEKETDGVKRVSFAFRLVFQSFEKTLSDEEVNVQMTALEKAFSELEGYEVR